MSHLEELGDQFQIPLEPDEVGYLGRQCPQEECKGYFKITPGTGLTGNAPCHCPYCGFSDDTSHFATQEQLDYAVSIAMREITGAVFNDLKELEFEQKPQGMFGIGLSLKVTQSDPEPIRFYREKQLETEVVCDSCTLRYAIYGVFGWCPDCGVHNSLQILAKNLELARKELKLSEAVEKDLSDHLVGDALENAVAAFDGFGREICKRRGAEIRFQNLPGARRRVEDTFGFDFADSLQRDEWNHLCRIFQKRHLLAHAMGVIDDDYVQKANDPSATAGRKIRVDADEVISSIGMIEALGKRLYDGILPVA
jgi:hypothetical protein